MWCYHGKVSHGNVAVCSLNLFGGRPHRGVCAKRCKHYLGDDDEARRAGYASVEDANIKIEGTRRGGCCGQPVE